MIDELTIAANGRSLGRKAEIGAAVPRLSNVFDDLLYRSASLSADEPSNVPATAGPEEEPRAPAVRDSYSREAPDRPEDQAVGNTRADGDPARPTGRKDIPPDRHQDHPTEMTESDPPSSGRNEAGKTESDTKAETASEAPTTGDGKAPADHDAGTKHGSAASPSQELPGAITAATLNTAAPTETVTSLDQSLLKSARTNLPRPPGPNSAQETQTTTPAETTAATQRQAGGLAKAIGNGGKAQVSVNVVKEAETLVSQPSLTLASAAAILKEGDRSNQRPDAKNGQAKTGSNGALQPAAARVQPQTTSPQPTSPPSPTVSTSPSPAQGNATTLATSAGAAPSTAAAPPMVPTDAAGGDANSFATLTGNPRGTGSVAAQATGADKLAPHHRPVAEQISVNISKAVKAGLDRIEIRLTPASLGRVEVRLEVSGDGRVTAAVTVDNRDTLELLRADARGLERALQDAGLKADSGNLSFNLRGHDTAARHGGGSAPDVSGSETGNGGDEDDEEPSASPNTAYPQGGVMPDGRIDIRA